MAFGAATKERYQQNSLHKTGVDELKINSENDEESVEDGM